MMCDIFCAFDLFCPFCESKSAKVYHVVPNDMYFVTEKMLRWGGGALGGVFLVYNLRSSKIDEENCNVVEMKTAPVFVLVRSHQLLFHNVEVDQVEFLSRES